MHEILIKAYADGIVESLKARNKGGLVLTSFAAVDLGEDFTADDLHSVKVKFYWETSSKTIGTIDHSTATTLHINVLTGRVDIGFRDHWSHLTPEAIDSAADWLVQQEAKPDFSW